MSWLGFVVDTRVTRCSVCGSSDLHRYGYHVEDDDPVATEFAECRNCGTTYLYKRPRVEPSNAPDQG